MVIKEFPHHENLKIPLGRPKDYPCIKPYDNLLFYIQRNQNINTVIYEANISPCGKLIEDEPIQVHWLVFDEKNELATVQPLNPIQYNLAYGCASKKITEKLYEFHFKPYQQLKFFLHHQEDGFNVYLCLGGQAYQLKNMYIHAEDLGVFPEVKLVEFYLFDQIACRNAYHCIYF